MGALWSRGPDELIKKKKSVLAALYQKLKFWIASNWPRKSQIRTMHARGSVLCALDCSSKNKSNKKKNDPLAALHQKLEGLKVITHYQYHALIIMHLCG